MAHYMIFYVGGKPPETPEEGARKQQEWKDWVGSLGDAVVNPGTPLGNSRTVTAAGVSDGGGPNALTGFSVVNADSMEAALEMAQRCPFLDVGTLQVAEVRQM
ncbi:MAG TPA: YciI family protein [bacterium]|nr:YciI family protein [bacterium]